MDKHFSLDDLCRDVVNPVFASMGLPPINGREVLEYVRAKEEQQLHELNRRLLLTANRPPAERLPLLDEDGYEFGRVTSEIPDEVFFNLRAQARFGPEALNCEEGRRDVLKAYPQFGVKTVSGKAVSGWTPQSEGGGRRAEGRINMRGANFNDLRPTT